VIIATMPGVTWEDVAAGRAPALRALGERWSMAAVSVRTAAAHTDADSAMTTIGAGNRARGRTLADNAGLHFGAVPGALGATLHEHGLRTAASDATVAPAVADPSHPMDATDPLAADVGAVDLTGGDAALADLVGRLDLAQDTLLVLSPYQPAGRPPRLMAAVMAGVGSTSGGWMTSATTHRDGLVTLPDVAPGILGLLGVKAPASMTGQALRSVPAGPAGANRLQELLGLQAAAVSYGRRLVPFNVALATIGTLVFLAGWRRLRLGATGPPRGAALLRATGLLVAAAPVACLAQAAVGGERWPALPAFAFLVAAALAVVAIAVGGPWRRSHSGPPVFVATVTALAIAGDLATGSRGQITSLIGYSPLVAGRFYGLSPVSFATLATSALLLAGLAAGARPKQGVAIVALIGLLTVGLAGAPVFGAKFGSILTLVPAFGLLALLVSGRRLSLAKVGLLAAAAAAVALGIGVVDALRPASSQTHIGRFVAALLGGGAGTVGDVIHRKLDANLGIYLRAPVALLVPVALGFVGVAILRPARVVEGPLRAVPGLRFGLLAAVAAMALGLVLNDSGAAIPAMGMAVGVPWAIALLVGVAAAKPARTPVAGPPG